MTTNSYQFWLKQDSLVLQLPFNPEDIDINTTSKNTTVEVDKLGEITQFQPKGLATFSFNSHFPLNYFDGCSYKNIPVPEKCINIIEQMEENEKPIRFIVTNTFINHLVTISSFKRKIMGGDVGSIYYDISLKEYRHSSPRKISASKPISNSSVVTPSQEKIRVVVKPQVKTYKVIAGDSLWKIAQKQLSNGGRYSEIANLNNINAPYTIYAGQILVLPS